MPGADATAGSRLSVASLRWVWRRLAAAYGAVKPHRTRNGLDQLICTLLSQNTTDVNSLEAFRRLKRRFPTWRAVAAARSPQIAHAIRIAGLSNQKSLRIKEILARLRRDFGRLTLAPLGRMATDRARHYLLSLPGVGAKTAACTLLFSFGRPVFPVDTHIHRVSLRLGLVPSRASAEEAHEILDAATPAELCHDLHLLLIRHGRQTCHPRRPACGVCALRGRCPSRQDGPSAGDARRVPRPSNAV
jgi:endonuclease-3